MPSRVRLLQTVPAQRETASRADPRAGGIGRQVCRIQLDEPIEPHRIPFEKVRKHVRRQVKLKHARRAFEVYIDSLRKVYAGEVKWFDEHLSELNIGNTR